MYGLALAGDLHGFEVALDALSPVDPAELTVVHPQSVRAAVFYLITTFNSRNSHQYCCCMYVCMYLGRFSTSCHLQARLGRRSRCIVEERSRSERSQQGHQNIFLQWIDCLGHLIASPLFCIGGSSTDRCSPEIKELRDGNIVDKMDFLL